MTNDQLKSRFMLTLKLLTPNIIDMLGEASFSETEFEEGFLEAETEAAFVVADTICRTLEKIGINQDTKAVSKAIGAVETEG